MSTFTEIINKPIPVLVDFYADWCGPCKTMTPVLKALKDEIGDAASIVKINVDKNPSLARRYQVRGVPTFMLFNGGQMIWRQSGVIDKNELKAKLLAFQN